MTQKQLLEMLALRVRCRVLRGVSWYFDPRNCRSANRGNSDPAYRCSYDGFRVALIRGKHDAKASS